MAYQRPIIPDQMSLLSLGKLTQVVCLHLWGQLDTDGHSDLGWTDKRVTLVTAPILGQSKAGISTGCPLSSNPTTPQSLFILKKAPLVNTWGWWTKQGQQLPPR